jgi:hypothetical protein
LFVSSDNHPRGHTKDHEDEIDTSCGLAGEIFISLMASLATGKISRRHSH